MARALLIAVMRAARRLIDLLLASDSAGNTHALARRMGIQELIWNCRAWWSGAERLEPYSGCLNERGRPLCRVNKTLAHRDHIHIGLTRAGARGRTSFWAARDTGRPARPPPGSRSPGSCRRR